MKSRKYLYWEPSSKGPWTNGSYTRGRTADNLRAWRAAFPTVDGLACQGGYWIHNGKSWGALVAPAPEEL